MQCNKKSAEKVAEKQLKQKQSKAEAAFRADPTALGGKCWAGSPPHPTPLCRGCGHPGGIWSPTRREQLAELPGRARQRSWCQGTGENPAGGLGRCRDAGRRRSGDWDQNSSEQGYGIFNEYAYYQGGDRGGEKIKAGILQRW